MSGIKYPHGCLGDYEQELIEYTLWNLHDIGECDGAPVCGYCLDEIKEELNENRGSVSK